MISKLMICRAAGRAWAAAGLAAALGGCTVGPNFSPPQAASPAAFRAGEPGDQSRTVVGSVAVQWWQSFDDPTLTGLEERVAEQNLDVQVATQRLLEARAQIQIAGAASLPSLGASGSYAHERYSSYGPFTSPPLLPFSIPAVPFNLYEAGFDANWEIDLFGGTRRSVEAARANYAAAAAQRRGVLLSALAELGRDYIDLRAGQDLLSITRENLGTAQQSLNLTEQQASAGLVSDLDVANARAQAASIAAQIPPLQTRITVDINAISLLLGLPPAALASELSPARPVPPVPPVVPIGLPSELLTRRPDVLAAEDQLHQATAEVGVAVADFYPSFNLAGNINLQSISISQFADIAARTYSFGPTITLPIFEGGELHGQLTLRKAQQKEAAISYARTVLAAFHDVDNALAAYDDEQRRRVSLEEAVRQDRRALGLAQSQYADGLTDFLEVLTAQQNVLSAEQQLATSTAAVSTDLVAIYKALGGGWQVAFPEATAEAGAAPGEGARDVAEAVPAAAR